jgi:hypothetical protein
MLEARAVEVSPPWRAAVAQEARGGAIPEFARPRVWYNSEAPEALGLADAVPGKQQKVTRGESAPERQTGRNQGF